jgi:LysR family transcriptional regulator, glycine cleavage system transcriptional activator
MRPVAMLAASPELNKRLTWIKSASDLLKAPLLHGGHTDDWRWWLETNGVQVPDKLSGEFCWHSHMALEAARLGRGILLANRFFFGRELARGNLVEVKIPGVTNKPIGGYMFVAREDRWSSPRLVAMRRFLIARMKSM